MALRSLALAAAALVACAAAAPTPAPGAPRLIFHVVIDDLGYADVSFTTAVTGIVPETPTPRMGALAEEGIVLSRL
jgi:arylsulfatase A-like enzyme